MAACCLILSYVITESPYNGSLLFGTVICDHRIPLQWQPAVWYCHMWSQNPLTMAACCLVLSYVITESPYNGSLLFGTVICDHRIPLQWQPAVWYCHMWSQNPLTMAACCLVLSYVITESPYNGSLLFGTVICGHRIPLQWQPAVWYCHM